jgi:hypothetical protein
MRLFHQVIKTMGNNNSHLKHKRSTIPEFDQIESEQEIKKGYGIIIYHRVMSILSIDYICIIFLKDIYSK